jgi:hypothetical protein
MTITRRRVQEKARKSQSSGRARVQGKAREKPGKARRGQSSGKSQERPEFRKGQEFRKGCSPDWVRAKVQVNRYIACGLNSQPQRGGSQ